VYKKDFKIQRIPLFQNDAIKIDRIG